MNSTATRWLLALDVDRTILTDDYLVLPQVASAIQGARESGVTVTLATARGPGALNIVLNDLGDVDHAICFGGALILQRVDGAWAAAPGTAVKTVDKQAVLTVASLSQSSGLAYAAYGRDLVYFEKVDWLLEKEFSLTGEQAQLCSLQDIQEPICKILVISELDQIEKLTALHAQLSGDLSCAFSHSNYLEVCPLGVSKGEGLALLAKAIGIDQRNTVAIGDGENDLPMLAWAGLSIAMANASERVRDAADWITASNAEAGVAAAIEKLFAQTWRFAGRGDIREEVR